MIAVCCCCLIGILVKHVVEGFDEFCCFSVKEDDAVGNENQCLFMLYNVHESNALLEDNRWTDESEKLSCEIGFWKLLYSRDGNFIGEGACSHNS